MFLLVRFKISTKSEEPFLYITPNAFQFILDVVFIILTWLVLALHGILVRKNSMDSEEFNLHICWSKALSNTIFIGVKCLPLGEFDLRLSWSSLEGGCSSIVGDAIQCRFLKKTLFNTYCQEGCILITDVQIGLKPSNK